MIDVRSKITEHMSRARAERELRDSVRPLLVIVVGAVVGLAIAAYIASKVTPTFLRSTYTVRFAVDDATAVIPGNQEMRFKGIPVGVIKKVELKGSRAVITATYKAKYGRIYRNAKVELRPNTPLMDMSLDVVNRGTPDAGVLSGDEPLPAGRTRVTVNVDDVLNVLRSDVRSRLTDLLDNLGNGLQDRGAQLREAVVELTPLLDVAGRITHQIATRERITRELVHNTATLMSTLAERDKDLRGMVLTAGSALSALKQGTPDLAATLDVLPSTLERLNTSFAALRGALGDTNGAVRALYPVADQVPSALTALRELSTSAAPAIRALQRPVKALVPFSDALRPVSGDLRQSVDALLPQAPVVDRTSKTLAACEKGVQGFFQWTASLGKFGDLRGPVPRGNLVAGVQSLSVASPNEFALPSCAPGKPIGGRLPRPSDMH